MLPGFRLKKTFATPVVLITTASSGRSRDRSITIFMRPMEYTEFFPPFHGIDDANAASAHGVVELQHK
eukprot:COSAG01_NODE_63068_length_281_cov_1.137363_1_plen_67_part_01